MKITGITAAEGEDILAFETSDTTPASSTFGGGQTSGVPAFEFVKIKKENSPSANELFKRSVNGSHLPEVSFEFYDNNATMFYKIVLKAVTINHFSFLKPECSDCTKLYHQVWFNYTIIQVTDVATNTTVKYDRSTRMTN